MALGAALVDHARVIVKPTGGVRVDGGFVGGAGVPSEVEFRCRFTPGPDAETKPDGVRVRKPATLMYGRRDLAGDPVVIRSQDEIAIRTKDGDPRRFTVVGDPEPIRKRRTVIGYTATLARVKRQQSERAIQ